MPNIEKVEHKEDALVFEATVEVYPEVEVKAFDGLEVERKTAEIKDADVDTMIENLQKQRQTWAVTKGMAKKDMQVTFDFEGSIDGEKFEGGSAEDFKLVLGSGRMIPGFEDGIIGMKAGEEKVIDVTFPEDYQAENLAGKAAQFKITVKQVEKPKLPEIDAEFLKIFGVSEEEGIEKLKADVRKTWNVKFAMVYVTKLNKLHLMLLLLLTKLKFQLQWLLKKLTVNVNKWFNSSLNNLVVQARNLLTRACFLTNCSKNKQNVLLSLAYW